MIGLVLAVTLACGGGGGEPQAEVSGGADDAPAAEAEPAPEPVVGQPGQTVTQGSTALTISEVERVSQLGEFLQVGEGNEFVTMLARVENTGAEPIPYNLLYFEARDPDGFEYNASIGVDRAFGSGDLAPGDATQGFVAFEIPAGASPIRVQYQPITFGSDPPIVFEVP